ncbi:hypothetical protein [Vibrio phage vB_ValS_PJ32]|nr:hypothetical protein [Vibrio phage vB_ValS_PJ32]
MHKTNFDGTTPFSKIPDKDFSSLEALAARRRTKAGGSTWNPTTHEQSREAMRQRARDVAAKANITPPPTQFKTGDVVGSLIVRDVTETNYLICECTCGQTVKKTQATIKTVDVCRHTINGRYSQEFRSRNYRRSLYNAWKRMCTEAASMNTSIYPPWQSFNRFVKDNLQHSASRLCFAQVSPIEVEGTLNPNSYRWITVANMRTIRAIGLPVYYVDGHPVSIIREALDANIKLGYLTKKIRTGVSYAGLYEWIQELKANAQA